jgi:hypothetical protein
MRGFTIGARAGQGGSPFPDLLLAIDTEQPKATSTSLEQLISLGLMTAGQEAQWQSKEIAGATTRYFTSIIGAGVYITPLESSKAVLLATSEKAISDLLTASRDTSQGVRAAFSSALQARIPASSLGVFYVNFPQVATVMDSVKGSLGMLTGGNSEIDQALDSSKIKPLGMSLGDISYLDGVFRIQQAFDSVK